MLSISKEVCIAIVLAPYIYHPLGTSCKNSGSWDLLFSLYIIVVMFFCSRLWTGCRKPTIVVSMSYLSLNAFEASNQIEIDIFRLHLDKVLPQAFILSNRHCCSEKETQTRYCCSEKETVAKPRQGKEISHFYDIINPSRQQSKLAGNAPSFWIATASDPVNHPPAI